MNGISVGTTLTSRTEFFTWQEALLQALARADLFTTATKPTVRWSHDRWVVEYDYRPVAWNANAA